ncbi:MAG: TrmH family RNA methyltransferase [Acidimicrobiales bacterium]
MGSSHQRVRRLRRLVQKRSLRWSEGVCVLEGPDLISAALDVAQEFEAIYVDERAESPTIAALLERAEHRAVRIFRLREGVIAKIADAQSPQPILAAVRLPQSDLSSLSAHGLVLVLHDVRDPGNVGTIIRSADAAAVSAVVLTGQSVDPFNPKTLRATAGSIFHVPVAVAPLDECIEHFRAQGAQVFATVLNGAESFRRVNLNQPSVVLIGNEASGLDEAAVAMCDARITIPMAGRSESLNAGVAASLVCFEALYQREGATEGRVPRSLEEL